MITDKNKNIATIEYNHLNLPSKVTKDDGQYIKYIYNAAGVKLSQEVYNESDVIQKKTDYAGEFMYENDVLQFINHEEGRVVYKDGDFEYQYTLKDHLGNTRITFTSQHDIETFPATMDAGNETEEQQNFNAYNSYTNESLDPTPAENAGDKILILNGSTLTGEYNGQVGLAKSFDVVPGDVISASVNAKFLEASGQGNLAGFAAALTQAFLLAPDPQPHEGISPFEALNAFGTIIANGERDEDDNGPQGFLNILVFDKEYNLVDAAFEQVGTAVTLTATVEVRQAGYVYVFLSNDGVSQQEIGFDNFSLTYEHSDVIQQDDYYPFGLTFNSYQRENSVENKYKFQSQEHVDDLGLNWDSFKWRNYTPDIGRFFNVDPLASKYVYNSPYAFSENHVTSHVELEGLEKVSIHVRHFIPEARAGGGFYRGDNRGFTTSQNVTSRVSHSVTVDTQSKGVTTSTTSSPTKMYPAGPLSDKGIEKTAVPDVKAVNVSTSGNAINVSSEYSAKDPLAAGIAPAIDFKNNISVTPDYANGYVTVSGTTTGDQYPAAESFVTDEAGNSVFVGVAPAEGNIIDSYGPGDKTLISNTVKIATDANGNFTGVYGSDGKVVPVEDHNKQYQSTKPNP